MMEIIHTAILILHVLGAAIIIGVAFVTVVIEMKQYTSSKQMLTLTEFLWKIAGIALGIQMLTGFYLAWSEWDKISKIPYFGIKMFLFFVVGTVVGISNRNRFKKLQEGTEKNISGKKWSVISVLVFATIAALGVLIAEAAA